MAVAWHPSLMDVWAAFVLSFFGKGKGRLFLLGWSVSMYFVFQMIYVPQFD